MLDDRLIKLTRAIAGYDADLRLHCYQTAGYVSKVASKMGLCKKHCDELYDAALIHDIGKTLINPKVLAQNGPLSTVEREFVDLHAYFGYELLRTNDFPESICQIVLFHHGTCKERFGIIPNPSADILRMGDILRCCDIFDALTSKRSYHDAIENEVAFEILKKTDIPIDVLEAMEKAVSRKK